MGYSFRLAARVLLYAPSHRQDSTYHDFCCTSHGALAGTRNSSMGPLHEGSIRRFIAPRANALTTELHLAPQVHKWMNEWMFNDTPARKTDRLLGVRCKMKAVLWCSTWNDLMNVQSRVRIPSPRLSSLTSLITRNSRKKLILIMVFPG